MRTTRIDIEGSAGHYATLRRTRGSDQIEVEILTPACPEGIRDQVATHHPESLNRMASRLQCMLDGYQGTHGDIDDYYRQLVQLAD
jgi:hypothetical protein